MADLYLLEELQSYLIAEGIVRDWATAYTNGAKPPCMIDPRDDVPQPSGDDRATVGLYYGPQIPGDWLEEFMEERVVHIIVRARKAPEGELLQRQIRGRLDLGQVDKFFGDLRIQWSKLWRGTQRVASDERTIDTQQSFRIAARVKALAGQPYA